MHLRTLASLALLVMFALLSRPGEAFSQACLGNSIEQPKVSSLSLSTGGVDLPHDMALHMVGVTHVRNPGALFGIAQGVYGVRYGAITGLANAEDYNRYAYRAGGRWLFGLPVPSAVSETMGACFSVGMRLSAYGYNMKLESVTEGADLAAWHFSWAVPVTVDLGYRLALSESLSIIPYISPGISPYWGGLLHESTIDDESNPLSLSTDLFTTAGVALNHDLFRVGLVLESGLVEYGEGTRVGLEAGVRW